MKGYSLEEISEMQGLMRGTADQAAQIEILAQMYGGTADDICIALGLPLLPLELTPNMKRHGWTEQTLITIRTMFRVGATVREISEATGLSMNAIDGFFSRHRGIFPERNGKCEKPKKHKYKKITEEDVAMMRRLLREQWNITDIAAEIGCSKVMVYRKLFGNAKENAASNAGTSLTAEISV